LTQAVEVSPPLRNDAELIFANFLRDQFGVQTMVDAA
jgi:hypothetical protein